ncbi:hypothetical protein ACKVMT_01980 [Halobacteriales archaeon Cl-PHB]
MPAQSWIRPVDEQLLATLQQSQPDYVPLVASRLGLTVGYAEQRFERLVEADLVEPVTPEVVYRVTEQGERFLEDGAEAAGIAARSD